MKSIFQIFIDEPLKEVLPLLESLMTDNDRHKQRAAAEVIGGV
jgi:proteasome activator subunit 4